MDVHSVNHLFKERLHSLFDSVAANASHRARNFNVRVVVLSPWDINSLWIPWSECETTFLVLHLLGHDINLSKCHILELYSHVANLVSKLWTTLAVLHHSCVEISIVHVDQVIPAL